MKDMRTVKMAYRDLFFCNILVLSASAVISGIIPPVGVDVGRPTCGTCRGTRVNVSHANLSDDSAPVFPKGIASPAVNRSTTGGLFGNW